MTARLTRRAALTGLAACALAPAANAHTLYGQWVVYRRKHLMIGCHRKDMATYDKAVRLTEMLAHSLPSAKARVARAPHPQRLASLIGTDQMSVAVLSPEDAVEMKAGIDRFAPYGALPLTLLADLDGHLFVAHADFPARHGWMVAAAVRDSDLASTPAEMSGLPWHVGAAALLEGLRLADLPEAE